MKSEQEEGKPGPLSRDILGSKPAEWDQGLTLRETLLIYIALEPAEFLRCFAWLLACTAQDLVETGAEPESEMAHGLLAGALAVEVQGLADNIATRLNQNKRGKRDV